MYIVQPRLNHISEFTTTRSKLLEWAYGTVKPAAELAWKGEGEFKPGEHCRFCKIKTTCRARAKENLEIAKLEFKEPPLLTDNEVAEVLSKARELAKWAADVEEYATEKAVGGVKWTGFRLVEGRANRKFTDTKKAAEALKNAGFSDIYETKLKAISELEKMVGINKFKYLMQGIIDRPKGKMTLKKEEQNG
jgi:hypothetical protein